MRVDGQEILGYLMKWRYRTGWTRREFPSYYQKNFPVNFDGPKAFTNSHLLFMVPTGLYHCRNCRLMGNVETFKIYRCINE